ncbi:hypothetical protein ACOME3_010024 [Neoechinorhynchus agilis]
MSGRAKNLLDTPQDCKDELTGLLKELDSLKEKLEDEKKKYNDVELCVVAQKLENLCSFAIKPRRILKCCQSKVLDLDWSTDKRHMITTSQDGKMIVWDAFTSTKEHIVSTPTTWVMACAYSPSGNLVACGGLDNKVTTYSLIANTDMPRQKKIIANHGQYISCCQFLNSDHQFLTGSGDGTAKLWDVESGTAMQVFTGHNADIMDIDVSPSEFGNVFVSASSDRTALVWDTRTGNYVQLFEGHESDVNCVCFYPSGDAVATGSDDAQCRLFDMRADRLISVYRKDSILFPCNDLDFSVSGRLLFSGHSDYCVNVWDALKCLRVAILYGHENKVSTLQVSPDGTALATGSWDSTIRVWA